jgi:ATP-dependent Zn protease
LAVCSAAHFYGASDASNQSAQAGDDAFRARLIEQANRADEIQGKYEQQLKDSAAALRKQEQLMDRWQKVIERWESVAPKGNETSA